MKVRFLGFVICWFLSLNCSGRAHEPLGEPVVFYVMQQAWHTGFVLDVSTIPDSLEALAYFKRENHYIEIGWGDEAFFQLPETNVFTALRAALFPTQAVFRVYGLRAAPEAVYGSHTTLYRVVCSQEQYATLLQFIDNSFVLDSEGNPVLSDYKETNLIFFLATRPYHLFRTCNTWVALALKESSFPVRKNGILTRRQLARQLERIGVENVRE